MSIDILIPFLILLILVIYLIYTRTKFEKEILNLYEKKFEEWKKHNSNQTDKKAQKELVGLVFKEDLKLSVELFDSSVEARLQKAKFETKYIGKENE